MSRMYSNHEVSNRGIMQPVKTSTYEELKEARRALSEAETMAKYYYEQVDKYKISVDALQTELDKQTFGVSYDT